MNTDVDKDSEDEGEKSIPTVSGKTKTSHNDKGTKEEPKELLNLDWSFLSTVLPSSETAS